MGRDDATRLWTTEMRRFHHIEPVVTAIGLPTPQLDGVTLPFFIWAGQIRSLKYTLLNTPAIVDRSHVRRGILAYWEMYLTRFGHFYRKGKVVRLPPNWVREFITQEAAWLNQMAKYL
jgi:hypothetical protein